MLITMIGVAFRRLFGGCAVILAASTVNPFPAKAELPSIGVPAAVRPDALGTPPGADERILQVGIDLISDEQITTGPTGQTHLLFVDGSTISIGPNSSLHLDKFVYDAQAREGELVVSVSKGLFRFVGGKISKKNAVLFKAPTAVIGIRGGVAIVQVNSPAQIQQAQNQGQTLPPASATMLFGDQVTMQSGDQKQTMTRPGFTVTQTPGGGVSTPQPTSQAQLTQVLSGLEDPQTPPGGDDGDGGQQTPQQLAAIAPAAGGPTVTDEDVSNNQMSDLNSSSEPSSVDGGTPPSLTSPVTTTVISGSEVATEASQTPLPTCTEAGQTNCIGTAPTSDTSSSSEPPSDPTEPTVDSPPIPGPLLTLAGTFSGREKHSADPAFGTDTTGTTAIAFSTGQIVDSAVERFGGIFGTATGLTTLTDGSRSFSITTNDADFDGDALIGSGFISPTDDFVVFNLESAANGHRIFAWAGKAFTGALPTAATFYDLQDDFVLGSMMPFIKATSGGSLSPNYGIGEADTVILWDTSGAASAQRAFGHFSLSPA